MKGPETVVLTAIALCLLSITSLTQAATNRIAVFSEPYFPYYMSDSRLTPVRVQGWLRDCGLEADLLSAAALADPERFSSARYGLLVHVYGNVYPKMSLPNIRAFHQAGGLPVAGRRHTLLPPLRAWRRPGMAVRPGRSHSANT